jgi:hypothetical protein
VRVRDALVKGADINYKCQAPTNPPIWNIGCMTALMMAAHRGDVAIVQLLLDKKADNRCLKAVVGVMSICHVVVRLVWFGWISATFATFMCTPSLSALCVLCKLE